MPELKPYFDKIEEPYKLLHESVITWCFCRKNQKAPSEFKSDDASISIELVDFIKEWLISTILKTETNYVAFFKEKGC